MRKLPGIVSSLLVATPLGALAADLPVKAPPPPPQAVYNWTGFYVGGNAGYTWADPSINVLTTNTFNNTANLSPLGLTAGPAAAVASTANIGLRNSGFTGGVQAGYNQQMGAFLIGAEADIQGISSPNRSSSITQLAPRTGFPGDFMTATIAVSERINFLGTVRARVGYLPQPNLLLYATGGFAYGGIQSSTSITGAEVPNTGIGPFAGFGNVSDTLLGYSVGAGAEWKFAPQWSVKAEYLYYNLGSISYSSSMSALMTGTNAIAFTNVSSSSIRFNGNIVRVGVNYEFGPGFAKY